MWDFTNTFSCTCIERVHNVQMAVLQPLLIEYMLKQVIYTWGPSIDFLQHQKFQSRWTFYLPWTKQQPWAQQLAWSVKSSVCRLACVWAPLHPVRFNWVGKYTWIKDTCRGLRQWGMWDSFRGCKDSFNLPPHPCPQQLLEMEGFKMPGAETYKSRLGWNKKEDVRGRKTVVSFHHKYRTWRSPG